MSCRSHRLLTTLIAGTVLLVAIAQLPADATRPAAPARAASRAADPPRAPITVSLDAGTVEWRTTPYAEVRATWYAGTVKRFGGIGFADSVGHVVVTRSDNPPPAGTIMDGVDRLVLGIGLSDGQTFDAPLPTLDAEVDAPGDAVELRGAAGTLLTIRIRRAVDRDVLSFSDVAAVAGRPAIGRASGEGAVGGLRPPVALGAPLWSGSSALDAAGRGHLALGGQLDIRPGDVAEVVHIAGGDTFVLRRTAFQLLVAADSEHPTALGRPGESVELMIRDRSGRERPCSTLIDGSGSASWRCLPIKAGDRITVTHTGRLLPAAHISATVPPLGVRPAVGGGAGGTAATLTGPPGGRLRFVEVSALGGVSADDVVLDVQGEAALPAGRPAPGGRHVVAWRSADGTIAVGGPRGFVPQVRLMLGEPRVRGVWAAERVTVTVAGPDGIPHGRWSTRVWTGSAYSVPLYAHGEDAALVGLHRLAPGDRVEVAVGGAEPLVWTLPDLDLHFDADAGRLTGRLPAGTTGTLSILEPLGGDVDPFRWPADVSNGEFVHSATLPLPVDPDGRFDVVIAALRDSDGRPLSTHRFAQGVVTAVRLDGMAVAAVFGTPWLDIDFTDAEVDAFGPAGQAAVLEVAGPSGRVVATGRTEPPTSFTVDQPYWRAHLEDGFGAPSPLRAGDLVTATVGASRSTFRVPALSGYVDLAAQRVRGRAVPGAPVRMALDGQAEDGGWQTAAAAPDGTFDVALPTGSALRLGDSGYLQARNGPHSLLSYLVVPKLVVDLSIGRVWGLGPLGSSVEIDLLRGGRSIAAGRRLVDDWQWFDVDPRDADGTHVRPAPGDTVVQRTDGLPDLAVTVPAFSAAWDRAVGRIVGQMPPGSTLDDHPAPFYVAHQPSWIFGPMDVAPSGAFSGEARHPRGIATGLTRLLSARARSGVQAMRWVVAPVLNVPLGGESVCGQALPWAAVQVEATLQDGRIVRGDGRANAVGRFRVPLGGGDGNGSGGGDGSSDGRPIVLAAGDVVRATVDGDVLETTLPPLTLSVDRASNTASGKAPAGAEVSIEWPGGSCDVADSSSPFGDVARTYPYAKRTVASAAGTFASALPEPNSRLVTPRPRAYEAAVRDAAGHRIFRISRALRLTALIDTPIVLGEADAGRSVAVTLTRAGSRFAHGTGIADAIGHFTATLATDGSGAVARLAAGDTISAVAGDESRRLIVPPLAVDWIPERGLVGRTDGGAEVDVRFVVPRGHLVLNDTDLTFRLTADAVGRFNSPTTPARGTWTMDDVERVEVWRTFDGDDRAMVAFDTGRGAPPTASPTPSSTGGPTILPTATPSVAPTTGGTPGATARPPGGGRTFLPWAGRGARRP